MPSLLIVMNSCEEEKDFAKELPGSNERNSEMRESKPPALNLNDVIMGRGSGANLKQGNINFRRLVWDKYNDEMARVERKTMEAIAAVKIKVASDVLEDIKARGGRFLRKTLKAVRLSPSIGGKESSIREGEATDIIYEEVSDKEALDKIKQTLRFQIERRRERSSHSGLWGTHDPSAFSSMEGLVFASRVNAAPPGNGDIGLLQAIDDRLLQMISQEQLSRLFQCNGHDTTSAGTIAPALIPFASPVSAAPGSASLNTANWPPLLAAAASAAKVSTTLPYTRRSHSMANTITMRGDSPKISDASLATLFLSQQVMPLSPPTLSLPSISYSLTSPNPLKTTFAAPAASLEAPSTKAANKMEIEAAIRREELQLMIDRIHTQRLTNILRQSLTQTHQQ